MRPAPLTAEAKASWFHPTPGCVLLLLLAVEAILFLSERFRWFPFNNHKGWTVLIAIAAVLATMALLLLWFLVALCFRRRFQFSLRSLMVLTLGERLARWAVGCVGCAWFTRGLPWPGRTWGLRPGGW